MKPLIKWAGGKTQLLREIIPMVPKYNKYVEPFLGGGATLFKLLPKWAIVSDKNEELINMYRIVARYPSALISELQSYENTAEFYYQMREKDRDEDINISNVERAARFIYLNATCYNGLYRVNKNNQFNTPYGKYKNPDFIKAKAIARISEYLRNVCILNQDFETLMNSVGRDAFVYLDPPYDNVEFTAYTGQRFDRGDQMRLRMACDGVDRRGALFLQSNNDTDFIRQLYRHYRIREVSARRAINSNGNGRGDVSELIITNF